jgi:hypothetical protein
MLQTPLPSGEPIHPRDSEIRWFDPVIATPHPAGQPLVVDADCADSSAPISLPRQAMPWRDMRWVGFAGDGHTPDRAQAGALRPLRAGALRAGARAARKDAPPAGTGAANQTDDAVAGSGGSRPKPAGARTASRQSPVAAGPAALPPGAVPEAVPYGGATRSIIAGAARLRQRLRSATSRLLRLSAAAASVGAVTVLAYQGGEHLAGFAGAMTPAAEPVHQAAALPAPDRYRAPAMPSSGPPGHPAGRAADYLDRARAGDPLAQYDVAVLYARGDGLVQDFPSAAAWFREAASAGYVAAQFDLAVSYERGLGVGQDMSKAIAWYRRAAEENYPAAQYNLAIAYAEGRGTPRDAAAAARWYYQAAAHGLVPAMVNFAILYENGAGVERSLPDAYAWYRAAARAGDAAAALRARELFQEFTGTEKGAAVMLAAALAGKIHQPLAGPAG